MKKIIFIIIIVVAVLFVFGVFEKKDIQAPPVETVQEQENEQQEVVVRGENETRVPSRYSCVGEGCDGSMDSDDASTRTVLQIPLVTDGGTVGCGADIFYAPHAVPRTPAILDATYKLLFDIKAEPEIKEDGFRNTIGMYSRLFYDGVSLNNGVAKVMLSGTMYGPGHCAEPEVRAQINQVAFYFDSVNTVEVYLNGARFDWCNLSTADPSEDGCDTTPKYWIDKK